MGAFATRLRELRQAAGLTQKQLAEKSGLHQRSISHYEQGLVDPSLPAAQAIAAALGVTVLAFDEPAKPIRPARRGRPRKS